MVTRPFRLTLLSLVLAVAALGPLLVYAQEPAAADPTATPPVLVLSGPEPVVVVPVPNQATEAEAEAVGESSAAALQDVASGETTIAEATRSPADAPDPGAGSLFWVLAIAFGSVVRPITDSAINRIRWIDDRLSGAVNTGLVLAFYLGAWALLAKSYPDLPQDALSWVIAGFGAVGIGGATSSMIRSARGSAPQRPQEIRT